MGSIPGNRSEGVLPRRGDDATRAYLLRSAARRCKAADDQMIVSDQD